MSRDVLQQVGLELPLFPVTSVGSFPKPPYLKEARARRKKNELSAEQLRELEEQATREWLTFQETVGCDVLVDGEMYRGDMVAYFAEHLPGFEKGSLVRSYGNRYYYKPIITGELRWPGPITVAWWRFAQQLTAKPVKGMLTGPYTIMDWSFNEYYPDRRQAALALARAVRQEVEALIEAGARIIQVDEPAASVRSEELPVAIEALHVVTEGLPAYFITHICYGDFDRVYPKMLELPVHNLDLEMTNSECELLQRFRQSPFTKDLSFGAVDVHSHKVEASEGIQQRIRQALEVIPKERLWVDPDCGLKTRTVEEAQGKLQAISAAVAELRKEMAQSERGIAS